MYAMEAWFTSVQRARGNPFVWQGIPKSALSPSTGSGTIVGTGRGDSLVIEGLVAATPNI